MAMSNPSVFSDLVLGPIASMTGFARVTGQAAGQELVVEVTSLNHRYFDLVVSLPGPLSLLEVPIRQRARERIVRGRLRLALLLAGSGDPGRRLAVNWHRAEEFVRIDREFRDRFGCAGNLEVQALMLAPGVVELVADTSGRDELTVPVLEAVTSCLEALRVMQLDEGRSMAADVASRLERLEGWLERIRVRAPEIPRLQHGLLAARLAQLPAGVVPEERLAQEIAILAERSDITEETVRFSSHLRQARDILVAGGEAGLKLDFLAQELNREINTIGNKSADVEISRIVVDVKAEITKIREQLQNLV